MFNLEVIATCRVQGIHCWASQPGDAPRNYLSYPHRHEFHIEVRVKVSHEDRDIEILQLKQDVISSIAEDYPVANEKAVPIPAHMARVTDFKDSSCEMIASKLIETLGTFHYDVKSVKVLEDGENGAVLSV
jgi:translation elongation factor EF-1beta